MITSIARRWRKLSGQEHWKKLLDPLDIDLRRYIIHYGDMAEATYDTFNSEIASKNAGNSKFSMKNLFSGVGLSIANPFKYEPVKYLYATSQVPVPECFLLKPISREAWTKESNWIGYIAVATDEGKAVLGRRDIVIAWRGSIKLSEWFGDFNFPLVPATEIFGEASNNPKVHKGWLSIYTSNDSSSPYNKTSARQQVLEEVQKLVETYKDEEISISITGHSLGAALATLNAVDIVANGYNKNKEQPDKQCPVTAFVFGSPHIGDSNFRDIFQSMEDLRLLRIRNVSDIIPIYPVWIGYTDVGDELQIDTRKSKYLKDPLSFRTCHNLEVYLHGVAGTHGVHGDFDLEVNRDIALVNKGLDGLKDEYMVPSSWRCLRNKGMVQNNDGSWTLQDHDL